MRALFTSVACDYCDGLVEVETWTGFVVFRGARDFDGRPIYLFRTRTDAALWRQSNGLSAYPICQVLSLEPFNWTRSRGTGESVELASRPYELFRDRRFEPKPLRAYLAHDMSELAA